MENQQQSRIGRVRIVPVAIAVLIAIAAGTVCGLLGWWQWQRAHSQGALVTPAEPVVISEANVPGGSATGMGQRVIVNGAWADAGVALVGGREVDGTPAVLLLRAFEVAADATGVGEPAILTVLAGWLPETSEHPIPVGDPGMPVELHGYLRGTEVPVTGAELPDEAPEGAFWLATMSTASVVNQWGTPIYSAIVVAEAAPAGWNAMPEPPAERTRDVRLLTYAAEWWLFGAFAVLVVGRWIRDNGRPKLPAPVEESS